MIVAGAFTGAFHFIAHNPHFLASKALDQVELSAAALGIALADILGDCDVVVDFTTPDSALENVRACLRAGVHVVVGTTGWDPSELAGESGANVFVAPNFAIGAVLMMRFAVEASKYMAKAEIIELHHDTKVDAPSGTAARTAECTPSAPTSDTLPTWSS